jgi:nucleotide-binding universal stress UspA family protein
VSQVNPIELKRILLPTDLSEFAGAATGYACAIAERFDAELHLLYVFERYTGSTYVPGIALPQAKSEIELLKQQVAESLAKWIDIGWATKHRVIRATGEGHPFVEIIRYAKEQDIDLIVMGTHGRSGISHLLVGSVAENVVRKSLCPVLTVRPTGLQFEMP